MPNNLRKWWRMKMKEEEEEDELQVISIANEHCREVESEGSSRRRGGSVINRRVIYRDREEGHAKLYRDYFSDYPTYPESMFRRRFRMRRSLFLRIQEAISTHDDYFTQREDAAGVRGLSPLQKITAAIRMLAYGTAADAVDDYIRIGESTTIESLRRFVRAIVEIFGCEYMRRQNNEDVARLLTVAENRGFPGMLGSIDCMHWKWKNCPTAWQGMYTGHVHEPTIILEAVASYDLWIWHAFFGLLGSLNDINVLYRSHLFEELAEGRGPEVSYTINGHEYNIGYYLADGIYPSWPTFVKTIPSPQGNKRKYFAASQESTRKDVERAFGVLQSRFAIIRGPSRFWDVDTMKYIMFACIIMHNMIVEDERDLHTPEYNYDAVGESVNVSLNRNRTRNIMEFIQVHHRIRDKQSHIQLQTDLVEHLWQKYGAYQ
ncbi:hypothetical protein QQ045_016694 [Rhodiola kirilowii]